MTTQSQLSGAALVTGASGGIGAVYADRLARRGHDLVLTGRDQARLHALAERLQAQHGVAVETLRADLAHRDELAKIERRLAEDKGIGVLVNNAGLNASGDFVAVGIEALQGVIDVNLTAVTRLAHAAAGRFAAEGRGAILNIGSVVGLAPDFHAAVYGATKAYVLYLTQALRAELGDGVVLQAVLPGATRTEIWDRSGHGLAKLPAAIVMEPEDLVDAALAGLDQGELVTIPSLPDAGDWAALEAARRKLGPNLSHSRPAARYGVGALAEA